MSDNEVRSTEEILERMGVSPHSKLPDDVPSLNDITSFDFHVVKAKGIKPQDVKLFRDQLVEGYKALQGLIELRDNDVLRLGDEIASLRTKLTNSMIENEQIKAQGVEIVEEAVSGVPTDVAVENAKVKEANRILSERVTALDQQNVALRETDRQMRAWGEAVNVEYDKMERELAEAKAEAEKLREENARLSAPGSLEHSLAAAKKKLEEEVASANEEKTVWMAKRNDYEEKISALEAEKSDLRSQLDALSTSVDDDTPDTGNVADLEAQILELTEELEEAKEQLKTYVEYTKEMQAWGDAKDEENKRLLEELERRGTSVQSSPFENDDPFAFPEGVVPSLDELKERFGQDLS